MANYNFLKQAEIYIVYGGSRYRLDVSEDISFSQTFTDKTYAQRTLHEQHKLHDASKITTANKADFGFTIPALSTNQMDVVFNLLVDFKTGTNTLNTFDLYIKLPNDVYKLRNCVITTGVFLIEKLKDLRLTITGEASQLTRGATLPTASTTPAVTEVAYGTRTHQKLDFLSVQVGSTTLNAGVYKVSIELQNEIKWLPHETINQALSATSTATSMYPSNFSLDKRSLAGSIGQYVSSDYNSDVQEWKINQSIVVKAGKTDELGFQFNLSDCSFTNRNSIGATFTQSYDWKMNANPTDLGSVLKFNNIT